MSFVQPDKNIEPASFESRFMAQMLRVTKEVQE